MRPFAENPDGYGIGCAMCFNYLMFLVGQGHAPKQINGFATFAQRALPQASVFKKHTEKCAFHKSALEYHVSSSLGSPIIRLAPKPTLDTRLWGKGRPRCKDWLRAWVWNRKNVTRRQSQELQEVESYINDPDEEPVSVRFLLQANWCGGEYLREHFWWPALLASVNISIFFDGKGDEVVMTFKACTRNNFNKVHGLLGIMGNFGNTDKVTGEVTLEQVMQRKSDKFVTGTEQLLKLFCTSNVYNPDRDAGTFHPELNAHIRHNVRGMCPDGESAMVRAQRQLNMQLFPKCALFGWDGVHQLRVYLKTAAKTSETYLTLKWEVWSKPHAFGKSLSYSNRLSSQFQACVTRILHTDVEKHEGKLSKALKKYGSCECRFDAEEKELEHWACTLSAGALHLTTTVDNKARPLVERSSAEQTLLKVYIPKVAIFGGMCGDWGLCGRTLCLHFDLEDPDPAIGVRLGEEYCEKTERLFVDGTILSEDARAVTLTRIVLLQLQQNTSFFYRDQTHQFWPGDADTAQEALTEMQQIVKTANEMIRKSNDERLLQNCFIVFDLQRWKKYETLDSHDQDSVLAMLMECLERLCHAREVDFCHCRPFFHRVKNYALPCFQRQKREGVSDQDANRVCWRLGLDAVESEGPLVDDGAILMEFYLHWCQSSCNDERLLGDSAAEGKQRTNIPAHHKRNSVAMRKWGPQKKEEIVTRHIDEAGLLELKPTTNCVGWQRLFVRKWGVARRFKVISKIRGDKGKVRGPKVNSRRFFKQKRREALESLSKDDNNLSVMKFVIDPKRSVKFLKWQAGKIANTKKMDNALKHFDTKLSARVAVESRRKLQLSRNKPVFSLLPSEVCAMTTKAVHESTAKATDNSKLLDELKKELNVFVHSDAEPLCSHIP